MNGFLFYVYQFNIGTSIVNFSIQFLFPMGFSEKKSSPKIKTETNSKIREKYIPLPVR